MKTKHNIKRLYEQGLSTTEIAQIVGVSRSTVYRWLLALGVSFRNKSEGVKLIRGKINWLKYTLIIPNFATNESAYWLGFLLGDGCVQLSKRSGNCIRLELQSKDRTHLEKFKKWLGSNHPLTYRQKTNSYSVRIVSQDLVSWLISYGIVPQKTKNANVDPRLQDNLHFWRGLVDADGHISFRRGAAIGLTGTFDVCQSFINFIKDTKAKPVKRTEHTYSLILTCLKARKLINRLYNHDCTKLDRKAAIAEQIYSIR